MDARTSFEKSLFRTMLNEFPLLKRGKVRDVYDLGDSLLIVATDRVSVYDVVLATPIPGKGRILTQLSNYWFNKTSHIVPNHLIETKFNQFPEEIQRHPELEGRSVIVRKASVFPVECVVRGYLSGSAWSDYQRTGEVCGIPLPEGMQESQALSQPMFTPATKAEEGHDQNISFERASGIVGESVAQQLREISLHLYSFAHAHAQSRGIIIADTKFEFGVIDDVIHLVDEVLTPDSSRFWPQGEYAPGRPQKSFDKQFVRDYAAHTGWNKTSPGPILPPEVVSQTQEKYREALSRLTQ